MSYCPCWVVLKITWAKLLWQLWSTLYMSLFGGKEKEQRVERQKRNGTWKEDRRSWNIGWDGKDGPVVRLFCWLPASLPVRVEDLLCVCYWGSAGAAHMSLGDPCSIQQGIWTRVSRPRYAWHLGLDNSSLCVCVSLLCVSWPLTTRC